jgi:DNA modification methylase
MSPWLTQYRDDLRRDIAVIDALGNDLVETDIKRRTRDRKLAERYVRNRPRLIEELDEIGVKEAEFCRTLGRGHSLAHMLRRMQLLKPGAWDRYVMRRHEVGDDGCFTLEYAVYLSREKRENHNDDTPVPPNSSRDEVATTLRASRTLSTSVTDDPQHEFICGYAFQVLQGMQQEWIHCSISSPPYWPTRRMYIPNDPQQIGFEPTLEEYLQHVVTEIYAEVYRVTRDDGVCWVLIDDAISERPYRYTKQSFRHGIGRLKSPHQINVATQDTTYLAPVGNWLGIPWRFALAMQAIGWLWRDTIIVDKGSGGRKDSTSSRCRHNFEFLLMFTKSPSGYWYYQDPLRIPLAGDRPYSVANRHSTPPRNWSKEKPRKDGLIRRDVGRDHRIFSNPLGRIANGVWHIRPKGWLGSHPSAMNEEIARRCLLLSCPPGGRVLAPFGGSGTVTKVAAELGLPSIYIDRHEPFVEEARQRLAGVQQGSAGIVANDNQPIKTASD